MAGTTDSANFYSSSTRVSMLYVKTHWDLNHEVNNGETNAYTTYPQSQTSGVKFYNKRFITPKKF